MRSEARNRLRLAAIGLGSAAVLLFHLLSSYPGLAESVYAGGPARFFPVVLSRIAALIPVSLAEPLMLLFVLRQVVGLARGAAALRRRAWPARRALLAGALRLGSDLGLAIALFYILWGFNYARAPLDERMGWDGDGAETAELEHLARKMIESANAGYLAIHSVEDAGSPTPRLLDVPDLLRELRAGWGSAATIVSRPRVFLAFGDPKPLLASRALDYLGISGFYFPWTGEANYNRGIPATSLPHVIAHEMSHQRGHAREDEANFMGYLVASLAPHPYPRYSAALFAQGQMLAALAARDREAALGLIKRRLPGVQRDIDAQRAYWERFEGPVSHAAESTNDAYLKSQRVPGGVANYSRSAELIVAYERSRGVADR